jgi:hypothetical protein
MRRIIVFSVLGPPLGFVAVLLREELMSGKWLFADAATFFSKYLLFAYLLGFIPAWFTGSIDWYLSSKMNRLWRVLATAFAGYVLTTIAGLQGYNPPYTRLSSIFTFGLIGILPAAVCSLLSGKTAAPSTSVNRASALSDRSGSPPTD